MICNIIVFVISILSMLVWVDCKAKGRKDFRVYKSSKFFIGWGMFLFLCFLSQLCLSAISGVIK